MKKVLKIVSNCLLSVLIIVLLVLLFMNFFNKNEKYTKLGNYSLLDVNGDSMYPKIKDGDLIAVDRRSKEKYDVGDIVSFYSIKDNVEIIVTHKIEVVLDDDVYKYVTKGINNDDEDKKVVSHDEIIGEYKNFRIPFIGYVVRFSRTNVGYWLLVVFPLGALCLFTTYELIKEIMKEKGEV